MTKVEAGEIVKGKQELVRGWQSGHTDTWGDAPESLSDILEAKEGVVLLEITIAPEAVEPPGCEAPLSKRILGSVPRTLGLPCVARVGSVSAKYQNGVLKIRLNGP